METVECSKLSWAWILRIKTTASTSIKAQGYSKSIAREVEQCHGLEHSTQTMVEIVNQSSQKRAEALSALHEWPNVSIQNCELVATSAYVQVVVYASHDMGEGTKFFSLVASLLLCRLETILGNHQPFNVWYISARLLPRYVLSVSSTKTMWFIFTNRHFLSIIIKQKERALSTP